MICRQAWRKSGDGSTTITAFCNLYLVERLRGFPTPALRSSFSQYLIGYGYAGNAGRPSSSLKGAAVVEWVNVLVEYRWDATSSQSLERPSI